MKHHVVAIVTDMDGNAVPLMQPNPPGAPTATHLTFPSNAVDAAKAPWCPTPFGDRGFWLEETANGWLVIVRERVHRSEDPPTYGFDTVSKHVCKTSAEVLLLLAARMISRETWTRPAPPPPPPQPSWSKEVDDIFGSVLPPKNHGDGPPCGSCGAITVRAGSCYACRECGSTTGCG